jgi:hypothetical protein
MVGLPGQTLEDIAADIIFFKKHDFDKDGRLNLIELSRFMEDIWKVAEWNQERVLN